MRAANLPAGEAQQIEADARLTEDRTALLQRRSSRWAGAATILGLLLLWEGIARLAHLPRVVLPLPSAILLEAVRTTTSGQLPAALGLSLARLLAGFAIGATAGTLIGLLIGFSGIAEAIGKPLIAILYPIPKIALLPLLIIWMGIGERPKVVMIAFGVFFPVAINAWAAVREVDPGLIRAAVSLGANRRQLLRKVILPSALPLLFAGYRLGAGTALLLLVVAEMLAARQGIGALILQAGDLLDTVQIFLGVAVLALLGLLSVAALDRLERLIVRWKPR